METSWHGPHDIVGQEGEIVNIVQAPNRSSDVTLVVQLDYDGKLLRTSEQAVVVVDTKKPKRPKKPKQPEEAKPDWSYSKEELEAVKPFPGLYSKEELEAMPDL